MGKQVLNPCIIQRQTFSQISRQHGQLSFKIFNAYIYTCRQSNIYGSIFAYICKDAAKILFFGHFSSSIDHGRFSCPFFAILSFPFLFFTFSLWTSQQKARPIVLLGCFVPKRGSLSLSLYIYIYNIKIYILYISIYLSIYLSIK